MISPDGINLSEKQCKQTFTSYKFEIEETHYFSFLDEYQDRLT